MRRLLVLLAVFILSGTSTSPAQKASDVIQDFGLLGRWAANCNRPEAEDNVYTVYKLEGGGVRRIYYVGVNEISGDSLITNATRVSVDLIAYDQKTAANERMRVTLKRRGEQIHVWMSQMDDGRVLVRDGILTHNGTASPLQSRCSR